MEEGDGREENGEITPDVAELSARIGIKDDRIRELLEEITASRLAADEARAAREAGEGRVEAIDRDRERLRTRVRELEEEARARRRRREGSERRISRLEREIERKDGEIARRTEELEGTNRKAQGESSRRDAVLQTALGRVEELEKKLEDREAEVSALRSRIESLTGELESERGLRRQLADRANRLRSGIDLFNDSEGRGAVNALSRTLGRPEVHVGLGPGDEPPVLLSFTWQGFTWQVYAADPNPAVEEPRVYLTSSGEDLSGVDREPPNARVGPGGRVALGL